VVDAEYIGFAVMMIGGLVVIAGIAGPTLPGTTTPAPTNPDGEQRYDLRAKLVVEDTLTAKGIDEDSFTYTTEPSGWFSVPGGVSLDTLSIIGAEDVELTATLTGDNLDARLSQRLFIGDLAEGESVTTVFKVAKLEPGTYTLRYDVSMVHGSESVSYTVEVP